MCKGNQLKKESDLPFRLMFKITSVSFVIGFLSTMALLAEPTKDPNLEFAFKESIQHFKRMPKDTKLRFGDEEYTNEEILHSLENLQTVIRDTPSHKIQNEIKKQFLFIELSPSDGPPTITGYYEVRINGKSKPEGEYQYPALSPPKSDQTMSENPKFFLREKWNQRSVWEKYSKPIVFLRLTDLHLAQLEGSAFVETETKEKFRINYAADNDQNYISPSVHLQGICPSLKPYHLSNCIQSKPKEVTEAILMNPRYIFFEKESLPKTQLNESFFGPLGSAGIRLVSFRSVAMDKQIPLGLPILLSFSSRGEVINNRLVFVHDRGNAITGAGRLDYYLGSGDGVEEMANNLLTKGKVTLLLPKKEKTRNK
ncbi:murein transglycosylase [Leptospira congkakensis]|uniref:peptidoglycan lytic exotransglycosylase n=1 Tax=Leptospira congkakensis TaxID=2484932 RepID=A0A4Z1ADS5_9LEPT|nr:MltA domain-containing protein [Leptospira congkakensis]TGL86325.1 murein transglycosylase [Leptospira congkakensis]TGL94130.1 murein transglycosylase [Leptospira congkakensis]TGL94462.1 murein transglycosylase [Leptospira congkakensis]